MIPFFNKKKDGNLKKKGKDSSFSSDELQLENGKTGIEEEIHPELSIHPSWNISPEKQYVFRFLNNDLDPLKPNQISLAGIEIDRENDEVLVTAFVRNSLPNEVLLHEIELLLLDEKDQILARHFFNFEELGKLPANSSRPWVFKFPKSAVKADELPEENWRLAFNLNTMRQHQLDLDPSWKEHVNEDQVKKLNEIINKLPALGKNEFNLTGLELKKLEDGRLATTVFLRNGNSQDITVSQLPLQVMSGDGKVVAKGQFELPNMVVKANTSKPWTFIFPPELVVEEEIPARWMVSVAGQ
ncbi:accessory Sec system S-layer assembly protein [Bacillus oleivorans]|uniref:Accessory Sec system S-layer assembly protein n=1 Tax=Bacillus oleivorans TaxID=1448271 RepID=A0A285CZI4_9BACI|nr:accessory Sec system S-layer assembly protein [Bacillus oleivorans]SNX72952.1 accessory Sec system S-layer assembly protein [Bacillus oleivorans]